MTTKSKINPTAKAAVLDAIITVLIYLIFTLIITSLVASGNIGIEKVKIIINVVLFASGIAATYVVNAFKGKNAVGVLISSGILLCTLILISFCWKGIEPDGKSIAVSAIVISASKVIPIVIKNTDKRNKKRKRKKNQ